MSWWMLLWESIMHKAYLNVDMHLVDVDNVAPPTVKRSDAKRHASLLSNFLLDNSLHFDVNEIFIFQS